MFGFIKKKKEGIPFPEKEPPIVEKYANLEPKVYTVKKEKICAICGKEDTACFDVYAGGDDLILACPKCRAEIIAQRERKQQLDQLRRKKTKELIEQLVYMLRLISEQKHEVSVPKTLTEEEKNKYEREFTRLDKEEIDAKIQVLRIEKRELKKEIKDLRREKTEYEKAIRITEAEKRRVEGKLSDLREEVGRAERECAYFSDEIENLRKRVETLSKQISVAGFDDSEPPDDASDYLAKDLYRSSGYYKEERSKLQQEEKRMVRNGEAVSVSLPFFVPGMESYSSALLKNAQKQAVELFDMRCESIISSMRVNNYNEAGVKIDAAAKHIASLNLRMNFSISSAYLQCKHKELALFYQYQIKVEEEKEDAKADREAAKEARRVARELAEERKRIEKEQRHYENAKQILEEQLAAEADEERRKALIEKREEILDNLEDLDDALKEVDYRSANERAGYVYVISNIGAFGKDIFKIGMTRRLNPYDRIDELGGASVPFRFDVHAMIFTADAPALEHALHTAFADRRVNMVNNRKEFFRCTLEEIEAVVRENYDQTATFNPVAEAIQYRTTVQMLQQ